ncbi:TIGR04388 family protein [Leptospira weilii]|uniref:TIGR04388 family protein n=1 Tax=Leptospira weilii TaxID=28184 RepID=UPI0012FDF37B|nr:TIGR04388 family protein [Leptospira weilii]
MNKRLDISKLEKQQALYEARGRLSLSRLKSNPYSLTTKIVSLVTIIAFHISFVIPFALFSLLSSEFSPLNAQSVPTLGSTKQFANDELKPYVDAAKAGATDSGSFLNTVTGGEQVLEAAWETEVNAEIESIVGGVNNSDAVNNVNVYKEAVRAQLELQKQQAKSRWVADAAQYIQAELQVFFSDTFPKHRKQRNIDEHEFGENDQPDCASSDNNTGHTKHKPGTSGTKLLPRSSSLGYEMAGSAKQTKHLGTEFLECDPERNPAMESIDYRT